MRCLLVLGALEFALSPWLRFHSTQELRGKPDYIREGKASNAFRFIVLNTPLQGKLSAGPGIGWTVSPYLLPIFRQKLLCIKVRRGQHMTLCPLKEGSEFGAGDLNTRSL